MGFGAAGANARWSRGLHQILRLQALSRDGAGKGLAEPYPALRQKSTTAA
jgi:hypothetical protein